MKKSANQAFSRSVVSNQPGIHDKLEERVRRHLAAPFRKPYADHNCRAFDHAQQWLQQAHLQGRPLVLDSFCGVGESTWRLAGLFADCAVIGVDKSAARLEKHPAHAEQARDNYLLIRADVDDFWRLAVDAGWQLQGHFLLYPNPWPKSSQLQYRVHGSPLFPSLLALGGDVELRSNWPIYVEEFAQALRLAGFDARTELYHGETLTPFERKYRLAEQAIWRCQSTLDKAATAPL